MRKSKAIAFVVVLLAIGFVLWLFFDVSLPIVLVSEVILAIVVVLSWSLWHWSREEEVRYSGSGSYSASRLEETARRPVQSHWPTRDNSSNTRSIEQQLEVVVSWLTSVDDRLERIEKSLARLHEGSRIAPDLFAEQPAHLIRHRSDDVANRAINSSKTKTEFVQFACQAYRKLAREGLRDLPLEPVFVVLDIDSSAQTSAIEEVRRNFRQATTKQSEFIIFQNSSTEAWLFPNPRISFTEAMKYVFPYLTYENFEGVTDAIAPERVRQTSPETWEMVPDGR